MNDHLAYWSNANFWGTLKFFTPEPGHNCFKHIWPVKKTLVIAQTFIERVKERKGFQGEKHS